MKIKLKQGEYIRVIVKHVITPNMKVGIDYKSKEEAIESLLIMLENSYLTNHKLYKKYLKLKESKNARKD